MPAGKEAETAETFSEDDYRNELIDKENYSEETAKMKAKKKKEQLANQVTKIEIDLGSLTKSKKRVYVKPTSQRKGHYREQEVGKSGSTSTKDRAMANLMVKSDKSYEVKMGQYILDGNKGMVDAMRQGFPNTWKKYSDMVKSEDAADEFEHLSPEERKKRQKMRDKQQKERAANRADRQKQHNEVEAGIPEGK